MEINLLVGSGISIPSKVFDVKQITEKLLTGKWAIQNNKYVEIKDEVHRNDPKILSLQKLLRYIQEEYSNDSNLLNYEELFYVIDCLNKFNSFPEENFIYKNEYDHFKNHFNLTLKPYELYDFTRVFNDIFKYFQSTISHLLEKYGVIKGLKLFDEIYEANEISTCNIFTLNHDLLLEKYFTDKNYEYNTGFNEIDGDVNLFNFKSLKSGKPDFRIIKLHGSINWYSFPQEFGPYKQTKYGIATDDLNKLKNKDGEKYEPQFDFPHFLSGTHNKIIDYSNSTFFELRNYFFSKHEEIDNTIVSGYGWRDEGINKVFYNWLNTCKSNKLHLLYNNLKNETGFRDFEFYKLRDQVIDYGVYLEDTKWKDIRKNMC
jgi:hypothetical protein